MSQCRKEQTMFKSRLFILFLSVSFFAGSGTSWVNAQDSKVAGNSEASATTDGSNSSPDRVIVIGAPDPPPPTPVFYRASSDSNIRVSENGMVQTITLSIVVIQGDAEDVLFELRGDGEIQSVQGDGIASHAVRKTDGQRFLEVRLKPKTKKVEAIIKVGSPAYSLPTTADLTHLGPADAVGFDSLLTVEVEPGIIAKFLKQEGFVRLQSANGTSRFQTQAGGALSVKLDLATTSPDPVEIIEAKLSGTMDEGKSSIDLIWEGKLQVHQAGASLEMLSGNVALKELPSDSRVRLQLLGAGNGYRYRATFKEKGEVDLRISMIASIQESSEGNRGIDLRVASGAVVPMEIGGLASDLSFERGEGLMMPNFSDGKWRSFLPANGVIKMNWREQKSTGEGKLFFSTSGRVEVQVGSGLLRQEHLLSYRVLQGELDTLKIAINGPGEILDVQGENLVSWKVVAEDGAKYLEVALSKPFEDSSEFLIRSQTALGSFPLEVGGMSLVPQGAIRHSGFLRIRNLGSVRIEPTNVIGLSQLSPEQFPGEVSESRQVYVYRFPAASHSFSVIADRIQPEVNLSELTRYELKETEKLLLTDIELDIREAPIRDWTFLIPADYSVVSVSGSGVADYLTTELEGSSQRELKVIFGQDMFGRQLVSLHLEKSEIAKAEKWDLPRIDHPDAKSVRGDIGILGAPGYRLALESTEMLIEKPVSYFPTPTVNLQHAFRMRGADWSAATKIEKLDRSIRSDVFHLYSMSEESIYGSALINYFITGAPVSELKLRIPEQLKNVDVEGQDVQDHRRSGDVLTVTLHQPVMGSYMLLVTFEEKPDTETGRFLPGAVEPLEVQGERGYIHVVSSIQVEMKTGQVSAGVLSLDPLEIPNEFRLLNTSPTLGAWQYTERPFELELQVKWFSPGSMIDQVVEFAEANTTISQDGEQVTEVLYFVKSRGQSSLRIKLPDEPVRLWEVTVAGDPETARKADDFTLIPLPSSSDPNETVEVSLRLGKPALWESRPSISLPQVFAPIIKTQWNVTGDDQRVISPAGGTVRPPRRVLPITGFQWVAQEGLFSLMSCVILTVIAILVGGSTGKKKHLAFIFSAIAIFIAVDTAGEARAIQSLNSGVQLSLPILPAGEFVQLDLYNTPIWRANVSNVGVILSVVGLFGLVASLFQIWSEYRVRLHIISGFLMVFGVLLHHGSADEFYWILAFFIFLFIGMKSTFRVFSSLKKGIGKWLRTSPDAAAKVELGEEEKRDTNGDESAKGEATDEDPRGDGSSLGGVLTTVLFMLFTGFSSGNGQAQQNGKSEQPVFSAAERIEQVWNIAGGTSPLKADVVMRVSGQVGKQFLLLRSPAILTSFEGDGVKLSKLNDSKQGMTYLVTLLPPESIDGGEETSGDQSASKGDQTESEFELKFTYQLETYDATAGIPVLTGDAAVNRLLVKSSGTDLNVSCASAVQSETVSNDENQTRFLLRPGRSVVKFTPKRRDLTLEETKFFVETSNVYIPRPGVVDGLHRIDLRASQGVLDSLQLVIPAGLTVSQVEGPVASWQFDAEESLLNLSISPAQAEPFSIRVETQRSLDALPADIELNPIRVPDADGEVGLLGVAFDGDSKPEKIESEGLSLVNVGDFDSEILDERAATLHRVYRYSDQGGTLKLSVAAVTPEVRVNTKQIFSLGDERVLLAITAAVDISRAGLFRLSFPLPDGFEVESLSGNSLSHWTDITEEDGRKVVMHLNGKTLGAQTFTISLTSVTPDAGKDWELPRFQLQEAVRQTGELIVQPVTGIRLTTVTRQNISEVDPRTVGSNTAGAVAYRLLQSEWSLVLGIEKLEPRISGDVLLDTELREGQTRFSVHGNFEVQNASIRSLEVRLPVSDSEEIKRLRANGRMVSSDLVLVDAEQQLWRVQFKRRVLGRVRFRIEYERLGDRADDTETLRLVVFPEASQVNMYYAVRAGGRLEISAPSQSKGWNKIDWSSIPSDLRTNASKEAPTLAMRLQKSAKPMTLSVQRHSLAEALKLRVASGELTTVLSPNGDQLTSVELQMEVIQRSSLVVGLPTGGNVFSVFVDGETVNTIRLDRGEVAGQESLQFYVDPREGRSASVKYVYTSPGSGIANLRLTSPQLNVPLENISWSVIAPEGYRLLDHDGNVDLVRKTRLSPYDQRAYLEKAKVSQQMMAEASANIALQGNQYIQSGEQSKANMLFNRALNQGGLDEATKEDTLIRLNEALRDQAIVGLASRKQQFFLDNDADEVMMEGSAQLRQAAENNPILRQGTMNFKMQEMTEILRGNSLEDNEVLQRIAGRLVQHQRGTDPTPQAILISLPEEGEVSTFSRSVQVAENAPLELDLQFAANLDLPLSRSMVTFLLVLAGSAAMVWAAGLRTGDQAA